MVRFLFKLLLVIVLAALLYGLWLMYLEKTPEQREEIRIRISAGFKGTAKILGEAFCRVLAKGRQVIRQHPEEKKKD